MKQVTKVSSKLHFRFSEWKKKHVFDANYCNLGHIPAHWLAAILGRQFQMYLFLQENNWISIEPSLEIVHKDPTDN